MDDNTRNEWLTQHIQTRMLALEAELRLIRHLQQRLPQLAHPLERVFHATWEGRFASARWLIEFVGITGYKNGKPLNPPSRSTKNKNKDFRIIDLGGTYLNLNSDDAVFLALLREDINKASGHPTHESEHGKITNQRLQESAIILKKHLQISLYTPNNMTLL